MVLIIVVIFQSDIRRALMRFGGRAWYLTGQADFTYSSTANNWITKTQQYSTFRYGLLGEVSYKF